MHNYCHRSFGALKLILQLICTGRNDLKLPAGLRHIAALIMLKAQFQGNLCSLES